MNRILIACITIMLATGCNTKDKSVMIVGKWQAVKLENPELDSVMAEQKAFLDTFGTSTTDEQNLLIYGFTNVDSARTAVKQEMDEYKAMQDHAVHNTVFEFKQNGWVIRDFTGQVDSTKWRIDDEGMLVLEEVETEDKPQKINMEILSVSDSVLKLRLSEQGMSSTVIFKPAGK